MGDWLVYRGTGLPHDGITQLPPPPPWRDFDAEPTAPPPAPLDPSSMRRLGSGAALGAVHRPGGLERDVVNAALYLRRPLLVTGDPGSGKSTLAHAVAYELGLGRVLRWPVTSRTVLQDGLYRYDAIGRLQDIQFERARGETGERSERGPEGIGRYLRLGPLGTALLPAALPRVLLVDELDKSDIDLPNDLLDVLEEGEFTVPELERLADVAPAIGVRNDDGVPVTVHGGRVRCRAFPFIVLTSNGERDFPAPLLRRCLHLRLAPPSRDQLVRMVEAHLGPDSAQRYSSLIDAFLNTGPGELRTVDQLLNAIQLTRRTSWSETDETRQRMTELLLEPIERMG